MLFIAIIALFLVLPILFSLSAEILRTFKTDDSEAHKAEALRSFSDACSALSVPEGILTLDVKPKEEVRTEETLNSGHTTSPSPEQLATSDARTPEPN